MRLARSVRVVQWGNVPAWVAAEISLIFGILSWRSSRKSKSERDEATRQAERAERAAGAAERQAEAAERSAATAEAQERREIEEAEAAEADPTKTAKYDVTVQGFKIDDGPARFDMTGPNKHVELSIMRIHHPDDPVEVTWHRQQNLSDKPQTSRKTIPSRI